jgi:acetolactate synthase-1/3 small subunit
MTTTSTKEQLPWRTLSVFTENHTGLLSRVTSVFTRRNINIESLTVSASELPGVHRFTIVVAVSPAMAAQLVLQLEKQVEVLKAFVHDDDDVVARDLALYKIDGAARLLPGFATVVETHRARVLEQEPAYVVVEKTGTQAETTALLAALQPYGVLEFVRSGRVALTRPMRKLVEFIAALEATRRAGDA